MSERKNNLEFYSIVWLGEQINEQIRSICDSIIQFHDEKQCFDYLQTTIDDQRVIFVIQDKNHSDLISQIIDFESILVVYIYTNDIWTINHRKVEFEMGIFACLKSFCFRSKVFSIDLMNLFNVFGSIITNENVFKSMKFFLGPYSIRQHRMMNVFSFNYSFVV